MRMEDICRKKTDTNGMTLVLAEKVLADEKMLIKMNLGNFQGKCMTLKSRHSLSNDTQAKIHLQF